MTEQEPERSSPNMTRRRAAMGYDARTERRAARGAARRRKARTKLWLVAGPAVLVIAAVVALLVLLGGPDGENQVAVTSTTLAIQPKGDVDLLVIEEDSSAPFLVLIQSRDEGGLVVAMPGMTILKTADGFKTLAEMRTEGDGDILRGSLVEEFGVRLETVAAVSWSDLRDRMIALGIADGPSASLAESDGEAELVARSVLALLQAGGSEGDPVWEQLALEGDVGQFRADMEAAAPSLGAGGWRAAGLTGRVRVGDGFEYLEPEMDELRVLLAGPTEGTAITVEIQNGAGMVGVVERATAELEALGYRLESTGNSSDFPNAGKTRIAVAADSVEAGKRVQALLGAGTVVEDLMLDLGRVVVVLGTDYVPPTSTTVPTG